MMADGERAMDDELFSGRDDVAMTDRLGHSLADFQSPDPP